DWFAGYRHGASQARQSGLRRRVTGPSSFANPVREHGGRPPIWPQGTEELPIPRQAEPMPIPPAESSGLGNLGQTAIPNLPRLGSPVPGKLGAIDNGGGLT